MLYQWPRRESNSHQKFRKLLFYPLNYGANCNFFFKNFLPAADFKYFSRFLAIILLSNFSKYTNSQGQKALVDLVYPPLCCFNLSFRSVLIPIYFFSKDRLFKTYTNTDSIKLLFYPRPND